MAQNNDLYLVLDNIRSILNIGAIFRTADAAGVKKVYLCGITAYPSKKAIKQFDKVEINEPAKITGNSVEILYTPSHECIRLWLEQNIAKTALKALGEVDFEYKASTAEAIGELKQKNIPVIALEQDKNSINYCDYDYKKPIAIVVGNEVNGASKEVLNLCDAIVEIPQYGHVNSLNVATATGIILFKAIEK